MGRSVFNRMDDIFYQRNPWDTVRLLDPELTPELIEEGVPLSATFAFRRLFAYTHARYAALNSFDHLYRDLPEAIRQHDAYLQQKHGIEYVPFAEPLAIHGVEYDGAYSTNGTREISQVLALPETRGRIMTEREWDLGKVLRDIANKVGIFFGLRTLDSIPAYAYKVPYGGPGGIAVPYLDNHGFFVRA